MKITTRSGLVPRARSPLGSGGRPARLGVLKEVLAGLGLSGLTLSGAFTDANWSSLNPGLAGADAAVYAVTRDAAGHLYIGGDFTVVGSTVASGAARWNGSNWASLGSGVAGSVRALVVSGTHVFVGGSFTNAGGVPARYVARWDGSRWTPLGAGMNGGVRALAASGGVVYAGGDFTTADGRSAGYIARWDGTEWSALGAGVNRSVFALAVSGTDLYVAGSFWSAGGKAAYSIARWDGSAWSAVGPGLGLNGAYALAVSGAFVYAAYNAGFSGRIARWDGSGWTQVGAMNGGFVRSLAVSGNDLFAGGDGYFAVEGGGVAYGMARWFAIANAWSPLGTGLEHSGAPVQALAVVGSDLYAGGRFSEVGGTLANNIARWNGANWSALGAGGIQPVTTLGLSGSNLLAGGSFTASDVPPFCVARWMGSGWLPLGSDLDGIVWALATSGTNVWVGGPLTTAIAGGTSSVPIPRVARWTGAGWQVLGQGMNDSVWTLAASGADLYAGGSFTVATNGARAAMPLQRIARWNGTDWTALASGLDSVVLATAISGPDLYAGGLFTWATNQGGAAVRVNGVAKWDGSSWSALGLGVDGGVAALAASGEALYAGGSFTAAGGIPASRIARWDGSGWGPLALGLNGAVDALAVVGTHLYAGGVFTAASNGGGAWVPANRIARWDGRAWSGLGSGLNGSVAALASSGQDLFVGGGFTTAGGRVSPYVARAFLPDLPALTIQRAGLENVIAWPAVDTAGFVLEHAGAVETPSAWEPQPGSVISDGEVNRVSVPAPPGLQFYRLRRP